MAQPETPEQPLACHVMAKPSGPICNINCRYCFYLEKEKLYREDKKSWRMNDETLELYVRQYIEAQDVPEINFAWQGGEPTLMGVDFFRKAVALQERYADGKTITNAFQTNGILIDDEWGAFLSENRFLVGVSIDGPREVHDRYRLDKGGKPTFDRVVAGIDALKKHEAEFNTLTVLQADNARRPLEVYRFLKEIGSHFMQFIPIVERVAQEAADDELELVDPYFDGRARVSAWSLGSAQYGRFLCAVFDEWVRQDVGTFFVQIFDVALGAWLGQNPTLCVFSETCGNAMIIEHNGDLYSCDHFVYPEYNLGNVRDKTIREMATSPKQVKFGQDKRDALPTVCRGCEVRFACNGGCPKHRFERTPDGEGGLNTFCRGYKMFFRHADPYMRFMANELRNGRPAVNVMEWVRYQDSLKASVKARVPGRNDPCPCGSGKKFKHCCGRV